MSNGVSNIVEFPIRPLGLGELRQSVWQLERSVLLLSSACSINLAAEACIAQDESTFFAHVGAAYAILERILMEAGRL